MSAVLAVFSDCVGESAIRTEQHARVGGVVEKVIDFAFVTLRAVGGCSEAAHAVGVTHLAVVGVGCADVLS